MNATKILGGLAVAVPMAAFAFFGSSATPVFAEVALAGYGNDQVKICHKGDTIAVAAPAVSAHLEHGDTLGKCAEEEHENNGKNNHENSQGDSHKSDHQGGDEDND